MKNTQAFLLSVDRNFRKKSNTLFSISMIMLLIILINCIVLSYSKITYIKNKTLHLLNTSPKSTFFLDWKMESPSFDDLNSIQKNINKYFPEISYGRFLFCDTIIKEFINNEKILQISRNQHKSDNDRLLQNINISNMDIALPFLYIDDNIEELCKLKLLKGESINVDINNNNIPVVIGYNYWGLLDIGDVFSSLAYEESFQVVGVLSKGAQWLSEEKLGTSLNYSKILDNYIVAGSCKILDNNFDSFGTVIINNKDESIKDEIEKYIGLYGYEVDCENVIELMDKSLEEEADLLKVYITIIAFIGIIGILSVTSLSIISVLLLKKEMGIMYSVGFSLKDMIKITIMENLLKVTIGALLGYIISFIYVYFNSWDFEKPVIMDIESSYIIVVIIIIQIVTMLSVIIPLNLIKKSSPSNLINYG